MVRSRHALVASLAVVAASALGCSFQASVGAGQGAEPPPPPPPPPPAAKAAPASTAQPEPEKPPATTEQPAGTTPAQPAAAAQPTTTVTAKHDRLNMPGNLVFEFGKSTLKSDPANEKVLSELKVFLEQNPEITQIRIEGHTDNVGDPAGNLELSGQRALTVKTWLVEHGIAASRLLATGFGEGKPVADNSTEDGRAQNRRIEFYIATKKGRKVLGKDPRGGGQVFE